MPPSPFLKDLSALIPAAAAAVAVARDFAKEESSPSSLLLSVYSAVRVLHWSVKRSKRGRVRSLIPLFLSLARTGK